jgi:hypothetical protein
MWIVPNRRDALVYDIEKRRVFGEVTNAWPVMLFGDPPRLLCCQFTTNMAPTNLRERLQSFVSKVSRGLIKGRPYMSGNTYWILNLANGAANRLGDIPSHPYTFFPSPDCRYSFTSRIGARPLLPPDFYLLDLQRPRIQRLKMPGWSCDWWDNTQVLMQMTNSDFVLYDVRKRTTAPLITFGKLSAFLREKDIPRSPGQTHAFAIWNGRENDFYLTDTHQKWLGGESFLIRAERPDGRLRLISSRFKFEWSDHLDRQGRYYLYSGREQGSASDGVFLRDLETGSNRVLVAATTNRYFSIPRFYRDSVIYVRSNALWQIGLDGASNTRVFPPAALQERN